VVEALARVLEEAQVSVLTLAAHRRELEAILVWKLDRWGRSVAELVARHARAIGPSASRASR
jgi:DNA invertase Pin-like site-specific DNA recombinase